MYLLLYAGASNARHADELQKQLQDQLANLTTAVQVLEAERANAQPVAPAVPYLAPPGDTLSYPHTSFATS